MPNTTTPASPDSPDSPPPAVTSSSDPRLPESCPNVLLALQKG